MKPYLINLINAIILVIFGGWAYFASETPSVTALIPVFAGIILISLTPGFRRGNHIIAHIVVLLTVLIFFGLIKPLTGVINRSEGIGIFRVLVMIITSLTAIFYFVKSFIDVRRKS